jgi:hypothetical protein
MMDSRRLPLREMLVTLFDAFERAPKPFVVKCSGGQDRTSFASALYIVHREGWGAMERAQCQFATLPYLHFPRATQRWLKQFLPCARAQANGAPLAEWIARDYEPQTFARALEPGSFNGIWEPWKPRIRR